MRIAVLPTGRTEWHGLPRALASLFPDHEFYCLPTAAEVQSNPGAFPCPGFTTLALTAAQEDDPPEAARELVERAAQEALGDRRHQAADLVLMLDDLELQNAEQPERVVSVMRKAIELHLGSLNVVGISRRTRVVLRDKVSFHLIAPMIEAWFFADQQALSRAGVPANATVCFPDKTDPEAFETADPDYLAATEADCPTLAALPRHRKKKAQPKWLGALPRKRHPKGYLQWLCRAPEDRRCTSYSETKHGGPALAGIHWKALLERRPEHFGFLRALVDDIEDALGCPPPPRSPNGVASPLTARSLAPQNAVLRNI